MGIFHINILGHDTSTSYLDSSSWPIYANHISYLDSSPCPIFRFIISVETVSQLISWFSYILLPKGRPLSNSKCSSDVADSSTRQGAQTRWSQWSDEWRPLLTAVGRLTVGWLAPSIDWCWNCIWKHLLKRHISELFLNLSMLTLHYNSKLFVHLPNNLPFLPQLSANHEALVFGICLQHSKRRPKEFCQAILEVPWSTTTWCQQFLLAPNLKSSCLPYMYHCVSLKRPPFLVKTQGTKLEFLTMPWRLDGGSLLEQQKQLNM